MKKLIKANYTFTPGLGGVGTIDFYGIKNFDVGKLYCLIHKPTATIFYALGTVGKSYSAASTTMVTLQFDTSAFDANDAIDIIYETDSISVIGDNTNVWRYGFGGVGIDANYFEQIQLGAGQTVRVGTIRKSAIVARTSSTATATCVNHGLVTGDLITILYTNDVASVIYSTVLVTVSTADVFTFACISGGLSSGIKIIFGQDISNVQLLSGTSIGSETILKSKCTFTGSLDFTFGLHMNQRIANTEVVIGLYEVSPNVSNVSCTVSATTATATKVDHGLQPGQEIQIISSTNACILTNSVRISNVIDDNTFEFDCIGGSASSVISYYSYDSAIEARYDGTSATSARFSTFRNVWDSPAPTSITTTGGLPNPYRISVKKGLITLTDTTPNSIGVTSNRAERNKEVPSIDGNFYIFIRIRNLSVAPASNTTATISFIEVNENCSIPVDLTNAGTGSLQSAIPVQVISASTTFVNPTDTQGGTLSKLMVVGGVALTTWTATTTGKVSQFVTDLIGRKIIKLFAPSELCWSSPPLVGGITTAGTTPIVVKESAGAGLRNYVNSIELSNSTLGAGTELELRDADVVASSQTIATNILTTGIHGLAIGDLVHVTASTVTGLTAGVSYWVLTVPSTTTLTLSATRGGSTLAISGTGVTATLHKVLWVGLINTVAGSRDVNFAVPLKGSVASVMSIVTRTAITSGAIYANIQGHIAP